MSEGPWIQSVRAKEYRCLLSDFDVRLVGLFAQIGYLGLDLVLQMLRSIKVIIGYVIDNRQQIGPGCRTPSKHQHANGVFGRLMPGLPLLPGRVKRLGAC
jgi:hypothetical protein